MSETPENIAYSINRMIWQFNGSSHECIRESRNSTRRTKGLVWVNFGVYEATQYASDGSIIKSEQRYEK